ISSSGIVIRVPAAEIRRVGRASQGVRTMRVDEGAHVVALAPVITQMEEPEKVQALSEEGSSQPDAAAEPPRLGAPAASRGESATRKTAAKKASSRSGSAAAKRGSTRTASARKTAAKKTSATRSASARKKTATKKTAAKKTAAKKTAAKKTAAKKTA